MSRTARAALLAAALALAPSAASAGMAESWYLARGSANMKIANYAAAIEAYRKALEANPRSREASRQLCVALLRNGETDRAVAELDRHLGCFPDDAELAFEQARILQWSRYAYRSRDAVRYLELGLAQRDDPARRRELARLLARDRRTLDRALAEYDRLLAATPGDRALRDERLKLLLWDPRRKAEVVRELERRVGEDGTDEGASRDLARLLAEDPRRAGEAADRYAALLERHPADPELRLGHARALARAGRRAEAREAYERALAARPSTETRLEYADLLAADPRTRELAREEYERALAAEPRSRRARLGLARVLGARKDTSQAAIAQYETVLASAPRDPEAHRGLAHAYAWNGDADRALAHGALADRYGRARPDVADLERDLRRGREPAVGGGVRVSSQAGDASGLRATSRFAAASADPTPFTSSGVEAGFTSARGEAAETDGAFVTVRGEWRPDPATRLSLGGGWDGARRAGGGASGHLGWERSGDVDAFAISVDRAARTDSYRAYAGEEVLGIAVGAASESRAELRWSRAMGGRTVEASARAGLVTGAGFDATFTAGLRGRLDRALARVGPFTLTAGASGEAVHHARDLSFGGDPAAPGPGLFSPPLYATASPRLALVRDAGLSGRFLLDAGPALQVTTGPGGGARLGGDARLAFVQPLGARVRVTGEVRAERIADVHARVDGALSAVLLFP